jgi:chitodextrinase
MTDTPRSTRATGRARAGLVALVLVGLQLTLQAVAPPAASAADPVPVTYQGAGYPAAGPTGTEDKPQSKLWYTDGAWWALMRVPAGVTVHRLEDHVWRDTGTVVDERVSSTGDALWDDGRLYVASRVSGGEMRAIRLSYDPATDTYTREISARVAGGGTESMTIARDSLGRLWVAYTQGSRVYVAHTTTSDTAWTAPFLVPVPDNTVAADDISAVTSFAGKVGVMWSDQGNDVVRFAVHSDTADDATWTMETAQSGPNSADDHLNLKSLLEDDQGRIYAAVKTSRGDAGEPPTDPSVVVLQRAADGTWTSAVASTVADKLTRPQLALDRTNRRVFVLMATESGGTVYSKTAPFGSLAFPAGKGTPFVQYPGASINDPSTSKQAVDAGTGLVVLASDDDALRYYHGELALGAAPAPDVTAPTVPRDLTATPASGTSVDLSWSASSDAVGVTGYMVTRDGAAAGTVTGTTFTDRSLAPGTTYSYTVSAIDAAGNRSAESAPVTAGTPSDAPDPGSSGPVGFVSAVSVDGATNTTTAPAPAGVRGGDVLVATVSSRGAPAITPPPGWTLVRVDTNGTTMRQAVYVRVSTGSEGPSTWVLNKAQATVVQVLAYRGLDTAEPVAGSAGQLTSTASLVSPSVGSVAGSPVLTVAGTARQSALAPVAPVTERSEDASTSSTYKVSADAGDTTATGSTAGPFTTAAGGSAPGIAQTVALRAGSGTTTPPPPPPADTTAPTAPQGLTATPTSSTSVGLAWQASTDAVGVTGYQVSRDGTRVGTPAGTTFTDSGLTAATTYRYTVSAVDAAGNVSAASAPATATTQPGSTPPPPPPADGTVTFVGAATATGTTTSTSVAAPTGVRAGDVLVAAVSTRGAPAITAPAGWTQVRVDTNGTTMRQALFTRVATGTEGPTAWTLSRAQSTVVQVLAYRGVDTAAPVLASAGATSTTATVTSPAAAAAPGARVVTVAGIARATTLAPAAPLSERSEVGTAAAATYKVTADSADTSATGSTAGPYQTTANGAAGGIGQTVVLRAAG